MSTTQRAVIVTTTSRAGAVHIPGATGWEIDEMTRDLTILQDKTALATFRDWSSVAVQAVQSQAGV